MKDNNQKGFVIDLDSSSGSLTCKHSKLDMRSDGWTADAICKIAVVSGEIPGGRAVVSLSHLYLLTT